MGPIVGDGVRDMSSRLAVRVSCVTLVKKPKDWKNHIGQLFLNGACPILHKPGVTAILYLDRG